ncbi:hypothetical protein L9F63_015460 [Diploptera punctata]|uniref:Acyltransferase 3 domain-containing protein n=1 Tax=Diploptera punctata TaxID=6984 RepID=A0AAD8A5M2_DIPPU|nr:hypothetical protein L9F63_015460 [Diploptera punctata]
MYLCRLTPPYAVMIMLQATLLRYISSGPLFNSTVDAYADNCKKYWWTNILYINNYVEHDKYCLPQSWYLAMDMQLFILSPIILIPLWKCSKKWSLSLLGALICAGLITAFTVSFVEKLPATLFSANPDIVRLQYYPTHTRFTPWLIGIGFGYFFYETKRTKLKLSKLAVFLGWCVSNVAMLGSIHGLYAFYKDFTLESINDFYTKDDTANVQASMYTTLSRSSWALGVGWVAYACTFDYAGPINMLLSWKVFRPLSKLTYCAYLVHASYQIIQTYSTRTPIYISDLSIVPHVVSDVIFCLAFAAILSLTVEVPVLILEKYALGRGGKSRSNEEIVETGTQQDNTKTDSDLEQERTEHIT